MAPTTSETSQTISPAEFIHSLRALQLLEDGQCHEIEQHLLPRYPDLRALAAHLLQRSWLTAYQINQLLQGQGAQLVLDSYVLEERLGEGGMGRVFKARHRNLGRTVAIKVLRKDRADDSEAIQRFRREIRAAAQLAHPNIVLAYDAGEVNHRYFFVMEFVDGIDLARLVRIKGPLSVVCACSLIRQAAQGLQHAFERGLVHRDVKPSNLLLAVPRPAGRKKNDPLLKVLDLGLARFAMPTCEEEEALTLTQHGILIGTPDYIAPEQAFDPRRSDIRSDLYSLGCTFYQLLSGTVPHPGGTALDKVFRHRLEEPAPLEQFRADVPPRVRAIVQRLLAKRPEDRYQTPDLLAADLEHAAIVRTSASAVFPRFPFDEAEPESALWPAGYAESRTQNSRKRRRRAL